MEIWSRVLGLAFVACRCIHADDEASNIPYVKTDRWGRCYAKSVPAESYGSKGTTRIFAVAPGNDTIIDTFDWYSGEIYLECATGHANEQVGTSVVQIGPWARGREASVGHLALAFYFRGRLVRRYSTLDLMGSPGNVSRSVSHYTVIKQANDYRQRESNFSAFEILTVDGRLISFDPTTGAIVTPR